jgi:hypothetical protein
MNPQDIEQLNRFELAEQLANARPRSVQWYRLRAECERRAARWGVVAQTAAFIVLGCMSLVALSVILR